MSSTIWASNNLNSFASFAFGCYQIHVLLALTFLLSASTSHSITLNSLAEQFRKSKKLQFIEMYMVLWIPS